MAASLLTRGIEASIQLLCGLYKLDANEWISRGGALVCIYCRFPVTYKLMISFVHLKGLLAVDPPILLHIAPLWVRH